MGLLNQKIKTAKKALDVFYAIDTSRSMAGEKLDAVNQAMNDLSQLLKVEAKKNPDVQVRIRILTFGGECAKWHVNEPQNIEDFTYQNIPEAQGSTPMGSAFNLLLQVFENKSTDEKSMTPIIILLTDGHPMDSYEANLNKLIELPWGKKAIRVAIAIGKEKDVGMNVLEKFASQKSSIFNTTNLTDLRELIKWTSTLITHNVKTEGQEDKKYNFPTFATPSKKSREMSSASILRDVDEDIK